jgi:hypothetical protein
LVEALRERGWLRNAVAVALGIAVVLIGRRLWQMPRPWPRGRTLQVIVLALFVVAAWFMERHEERWHLVQFGVLGVLLHQALAGSRGGLFFALALGALAGWLDEVWQSLLPGRVFGLDDVVVNVTAAIAGALSSAAGVVGGTAPLAGQAPPFVEADPSESS